MTIDELRVNLDLNIGNPMSILSILKANAKECSVGWLFVDSDEGCCYLFGEDGKEKDISELTAIDNELFYNDNALTKIVLPDNVTSIGDYAFPGCHSLTSMMIPNSVTSIGKLAFYICSSLTSVMIPDSVKNIGPGVFYGCDMLTSLVFKGKTIAEVKKMENYPFGIKDESIIGCEALS